MNAALVLSSTVRAIVAVLLVLSVGKTFYCVNWIVYLFSTDTAGCV